jgi:hypothetical protein
LGITILARCNFDGTRIEQIRFIRPILPNPRSILNPENPEIRVQAF